LLGIKATTENTLQLAKRYLVCLVVVGIASNCYYYYLNVQAEERVANDRNQVIDQASLFTDAFVGILLPMTVWMLCIIRAFQFQHLIREAENEAEERTRGLTEGAAEDDSADAVHMEEGEPSRSLPYGSNELELQVDRDESR